MLSFVTLQNTLEICTDVLIRVTYPTTIIPEVCFFEHMHLATDGVEFSFNNMHAKKMMGSLLGHVLANIFVVYHKNLLFERHRKQHIYLRQVDEPFPIFDSIKAFHV